MKKRRGNTTIQRELDNRSWNNQSNARGVITDHARLLADPREKAKVDFMREIKWNQGLTRTEALVGNEKERSELMQVFDHGDVSKLEEIRDIAVSYRLKFLPAERFMCPEKYELTLAGIITEFAEKKGVELVKNNFHILADEKYFLERQTEIDDKIGVVIFYRPPKDENNFLRVDHIGDGELTQYRYWMGWAESSPISAGINAAVMGFFGGFVLGGFLLGDLKSIIIGFIAAAATVYLANAYMTKQKGGYGSHTWNKLHRS